MLKKKYLYALVLGLGIGFMMPFEPKEVMFWVIALPLIVLGNWLYNILED